MKVETDAKIVFKSMNEIVYGLFKLYQNSEI